jgi:cardiolipin synthase
MSTAESRWRRVARRSGRVARWTLGAIVLVLAYVGLLHLTRGTAVRRVLGLGADGRPVGPAEPQFALSVAMLTGAPLVPGNRIEVALNGDGTYPRLLDDLRSARSSILMQTYYGHAGRLADALHQVLLERTAAGVRVFVLYDAFGSHDIPPDRLAALAAAGVIVVPFRPLRLSTLHLAQNRSHVRGIVVDGRVAWTGGFGVDDKWLGDGLTAGSWRETNVRFEGPAVRQLQAAFAASWAEATGVMFSGRATVAGYEDGVAAAGLLYASPTMGSTAAERFFALSIAGARRTLYITNAYFSPDRTFIELLTDAARRGVDVRILTAGPRTDLRTLRLAGRAWYETLLAGGVRVYEWQPSALHAKTFVVDGVWSTVGTMNFDNRSMALNEEVTLMVLDPEFGRRMDAIFIEDLRHCQEITLAGFRQRPWHQRLGERAANLITRLL